MGFFSATGSSDVRSVQVKVSVKVSTERTGTSIYGRVPWRSTSLRLSILFGTPPPVPPLLRRFGVALGSLAVALVISRLLAPAWGMAGAYAPVLGALVVAPGMAGWGRR